MAFFAASPPAPNAANTFTSPLARALVGKKKGANVEATDLDGYTALYYAAQAENPGVLKLLLQHMIGVKQHVDRRAGFFPLVRMLEKLAQAAAIVVARRTHPHRWPRLGRCNGRHGKQPRERTATPGRQAGQGHGEPKGRNEGAFSHCINFS